MAELHALLVTVLLVTLPVFAETPPIGIGQLTVQGNRLALYGDSQTVDWDQTVNVGEAIRIRTCYGTLTAACGSATASDPSLAGLKVVGELSGPELPQPLSFETIPGGSFFLPGFQTEGDYVLSNIRLVESATSRVLGTATPLAATIHVRQILLASATVTRLSLADLQARGIAITQESFQAFFRVGDAYASWDERNAVARLLRRLGLLKLTEIGDLLKVGKRQASKLVGEGRTILWE